MRRISIGEKQNMAPIMSLSNSKKWSACRLLDDLGLLCDHGAKFYARARTHLCGDHADEGLDVELCGAALLARRIRALEASVARKEGRRRIGWCGWIGCELCKSWVSHCQYVLGTRCWIE